MNYKRLSTNNFIDNQTRLTKFLKAARSTSWKVFVDTFNRHQSHFV